jgi:hypothetical protein
MARPPREGKGAGRRLTSAGPAPGMISRSEVSQPSSKYALPRRRFVADMGAAGKQS